MVMEMGKKQVREREFQNILQGMNLYQHYMSHQKQEEALHTAVCWIGLQKRLQYPNQRQWYPPIQHMKISEDLFINVKKKFMVGKLASSLGRQAGQICPCSQLNLPHTFNKAISFAFVIKLYSGWVIIFITFRLCSFVSGVSSFQAPHANLLLLL